MWVLLTSVSPALLAQDMADALVTAEMIDGEAYLDLHGLDLGTDALASFVYSNTTICDYKVLLSVEDPNANPPITCFQCSTSIGQINANTTNGSIPYTLPLCSTGQLVCGIRIIDLSSGGSTGNNNCSLLEKKTSISSCDGTKTVVFNYCNQVRIY